MPWPEQHAIRPQQRHERLGDVRGSDQIPAHSHFGRKLARRLGHSQQQHGVFTGRTPWGGGWSFQEFSAVCWYTGRALFEKLQGKVPIGLVAAEVGGTPVEAWSGPDARKHCDQTQVVDRVGTLWTSMIVPLLDMKMSAQIWYQGENNVAGPFGGGCCIIGCPLRPSPPRTPGANGCFEPCKASANKCADFYGCQVFD